MQRRHTTAGPHVTRQLLRRTTTLALVAAAVASSTLIAVQSLAGNPDGPPNIVLIFTDDQGYADLGSFGSKKIRTPNLDRVAREGMRLTSFYAQAVCGPSRAALMTGCYPIRVAEPGNRKHQHTILHPDEITIAEVLKSAGYATGCIGKWHVGLRSGDGWDARTMPVGQGFDSFYGTPLYNGFTVRVADTKFRSPILRNKEVVVDAVESWDHVTQDYTKEAIQFIRANKDRPFFLYLAHNMPHIPLGASEKFKGRSAFGPYGDAIEEIDWSAGEILRTLAELGIDRRTLVVFTSDNGPWIETSRGNVPGGKPLIPREHSGTADPLRGYKMLTWEGGLRVPCLMRWPGRVPAGTTCDQLAATIDLLPTFAALAGAKLPHDRILDGRDIRPLMFAEAGAKSPHEAFYYYCYTHLQAVRSGRWKLVLPRPEYPRWTGWSGRFYGSGVEKTELYDLETDVGEARDVAAENPEVVARLMKLVEKGRQDLGDYDRIGRGARFFDQRPKRPDMDFWKRPKARSMGRDEKGDKSKACRGVLIRIGRHHFPRLRPSATVAANTTIPTGDRIAMRRIFSRGKHGPSHLLVPWLHKITALILTSTAAIYGMVENIDDNVGRLLGKLDGLNLAGNTVVIFLSDNGPEGAEGSRYNAGMRGMKGSDMAAKSRLNALTPRYRS